MSNSHSQPRAVKTTIGGLAGRLIGNLLVGRPDPRRAAAGRPAARDPQTPPAERGIWMTASDEGKCGACGASIAPGDRVLRCARHTLCNTCG